MSAYGLHKIYGGTFQRNKPGLCETCAHRRDYGEWEGYCVLRQKILSYQEPGKGKPRCPDRKIADVQEGR